MVLLGCFVLPYFVARLIARAARLNDHAWKIWLVLTLSYAVHWAPRNWVTSTGLSFRRLPAVVQGTILAVVLGWMVHLSNTQPVPFIYFQF